MAGVRVASIETAYIGLSAAARFVVPNVVPASVAGNTPRDLSIFVAAPAGTIFYVAGRFDAIAIPFRLKTLAAMLPVRLAPAFAAIRQFKAIAFKAGVRRDLVLI